MSGTRKNTASNPRHHAERILTSLPTMLVMGQHKQWNPGSNKVLNWPRSSTIPTAAVNVREGRESRHEPVRCVTFCSPQEIHFSCTFYAPSCVRTHCAQQQPCSAMIMSKRVRYKQDTSNNDDALTLRDVCQDLAKSRWDSRAKIPDSIASSSFH